MTEPAQRSPEWYAERRNRVTASLCGAILGVAPYLTRDGAMRSMVRDALGAESEFSGNVATEHGVFHEDGAIFDFQLETRLSVTKAPFVKFEDWLGASPDGYTSDGGLIEVKCPYYIRNDRNPVFKALADQPHYAAQIFIQLFVTQAPHCWFWQWTPHGHKLEKVEPDLAWLNENLPVLRQFHAQFLYEVAESADEHLSPLRVTLDTPEAHRMVKEWDELAEQIERLTERKKDLLASMVKASGDKNALVAGRKLTLVKKAGSISYASAIKKLAPNADLEPYRGKASESWQLR